MRFRLLSFIAVLTVNSTIYAQTPQEVMTAYRAYNAAMEIEDFPAAIQHAKKAWDEAEKQLGDHRNTGDLAYNYGFIEKNRGDSAKAVKALVRSAELAHLKNEDAGLVRLEREVEAVSSLEAAKKYGDAKNRIDAALKFAGANGLSQNVFAGELHMHNASHCNILLNRKVNSGKKQIGSLINTGGSEKGIRDGQKKCERMALRAADIFDSTPTEARPSYISGANTMVGYSLELQKDWFGAAMRYQKARKAVEDIYPRDHPVAANAIGRWINARNYLERLDKLEKAEADGLCQCWPYSDRRRTVQPSKTVKVNFPYRGLNTTSGFAIVKFDVTDAGKTENIHIVQSFPDDVYDKASIKAIEQWQYPAKTEGEPDDFRTGIIQPFSFYLSSNLDPL